MTTSHKTAMAALVVVLAAGAAGCGGKKSATPQAGGSPKSPTTAPATTAPASTGAPAPGGGGTGACRLISAAEAAQLAKTPVQPGVERSLPVAQGITETYCTYNFQPGNAPAVLVAVASGPNVFTLMRQADASESDFEGVHGIGDEAYRCCGGNLKVRHGDTALILSIGQRNGVAGDTPVADLKRLAALVISRL